MSSPEVYLNPESHQIPVYVTEALYEALGNAGVATITVLPGHIEAIRKNVTAIRRGNTILAEHPLPNLTETALVLRAHHWIGQDAYVNAANRHATYRRLSHVAGTPSAKTNGEQLVNHLQQSGQSAVEISMSSFNPNKMAEALGTAYLEYPFYPKHRSWFRNLISDADFWISDEDYMHVQEASRSYTPFFIAYRKLGR